MAKKATKKKTEKHAHGGLCPENLSQIAGECVEQRALCRGTERAKLLKQLQCACLCVESMLLEEARESD